MNNDEMNATIAELQAELTELSQVIAATVARLPGNVTVVAPVNQETMAAVLCEDAPKHSPAWGTPED